MGGFVALATGGRVTFDRGEFNGAIGDSITLIPLVVALATLTDVSLPHVLVGFGGVPSSVGRPVWAPAVGRANEGARCAHIAGSLTYAELALAGVALGVVLFVVLLVVGLSWTLGAVERWIGGLVIRGVQFAVALVLFETGVDLALATPRVGAVGVGLVGIAIVAGCESAVGLVVVAIGGLGVFTNLGLAFLLGVFTHLVWTRHVHRQANESA